MLPTIVAAIATAPGLPGVSFVNEIVQAYVWMHRLQGFIVGGLIGLCAGLAVGCILTAIGVVAGRRE